MDPYPKRTFHIQLKPDSVPYHCKGPYSVPAISMPVLKKDLQRQQDIGVLERVGESEWGMPMMVIPKKDGAIRRSEERSVGKECRSRWSPYH